MKNKKERAAGTAVDLRSMGRSAKRDAIREFLLVPENLAKSDRANAVALGVAHTTVGEYRVRLSEEIMRVDNPLNLGKSKLAYLRRIVQRGSVEVERCGQKFKMRQKSPFRKTPDAGKTPDGKNSSTNGNLSGVKQVSGVKWAEARKKPSVPSLNRMRAVVDARNGDSGDLHENAPSETDEKSVDLSEIVRELITDFLTESPMEDAESVWDSLYASFVSERVNGDVDLIAEVRSQFLAETISR